MTFLCLFYDIKLKYPIFITMNSENKISIPIILYGVLFIIAVHSFGLVLDKLAQTGLCYTLEFDELPFVRLIILFFEIIFIVKFFKNKLGQSLEKKSLFYMLILSILGLISWLLIQDYYLLSPFLGCAYSLFDGSYERIYESYNNNIKTVQIIEIIVISISIFIYTIFRISEMPKESEDSE